MEKDLLAYATNNCGSFGMCGGENVYDTLLFLAKALFQIDKIVTQNLMMTLCSLSDHIQNAPAKKKLLAACWCGIDSVASGDRTLPCQKDAQHLLEHHQPHLQDRQY